MSEALWLGCQQLSGWSSPTHGKDVYRRSELHLYAMFLPKRLYAKGQGNGDVQDVESGPKNEDQEPASLRR